MQTCKHFPRKFCIIDYFVYLCSRLMSNSQILFHILKLISMLKTIRQFILSKMFPQCKITAARFFLIANSMRR